VRRQTVEAEIVGVVPPAQEAVVLEDMSGLDVLVELETSRWTPGRALNAGAAAATAPVHATVTAGYELPRDDWSVRLLAHLQRPAVEAACGAVVDADGTPLRRPRTIGAADWEPRWGFCMSAAGWKADAWARQPFDDDVPAATDRIWARKTLRRGGLIVVDPFLALSGPPLRVPTAWSIFRGSAAEWRSLVSAGAPVAAPTLGEALESWWREVDTGSATPAALQRLNYFRLARALGRWVGGRAARAERRHG
jgi:rhamnosyltransferase